MDSPTLRSPLIESLNDATLDDPEVFRTHLLQLVQQIKSENSTLNAFVRWYLSEESINRQFEILVSKKQGLPLFGSAFAAKDCFRVARHPMSFGLHPPLESNATEHAALIALCIRAGATLIGSTIMDAAGVSNYGDNPNFGRTQNPIAKERVPGGSSSGSATAVAAGLCDFSLGTDADGGTRAPAAACGVVGLKTSLDLLSTEGSLMLSNSLDTPGLLTRTLDDLRYLLEVILPDEQLPLFSEPPQFIVPCDKELAYADETTRALFSHALTQLRQTCQIQPLEFSLGFTDANATRKIVQASDYYEMLLKADIRHSRLPIHARSILAHERALAPSQKEDAQDLQAALTAKLHSLVDERTFILTPTLPATPPAWKDLKKGRAAMPSSRMSTFLGLANLCSLSAVAFPIPSPAGQIPFSLQVVGAHMNDYRTVLAAGELQKALGADTDVTTL